MKEDCKLQGDGDKYLKKGVGLREKDAKLLKNNAKLLEKEGKDVTLLKNVKMWAKMLN